MHRRFGLRPLVSICIPTFNRAQYLRECLRSVLAQTYPNIEIIVSDNCSSDSTRSLLEETCGLVLNFQSSNVGMVANWNAALKLAQGKYCILLSDDDILMPNCIETLVNYMHEPEAQFAYTPVIIVDSKGKPKGVSPAGPYMESGREFVDATLKQKRVPYPSAILFRRKSAEAIGYFVDIGNQTDVAFRISLAEVTHGGRIFCHPEPLVKYRIHATSLTDDPVKRVEGRLNFQKWIAARYRASSRYYQLAILDLLNLKAKGLPLPECVFDTLKREDSSARIEASLFSYKVRLYIQRGWTSRPLLLLLFPVLVLQLAARLLANRNFHKRYVS